MLLECISMDCVNEAIVDVANEAQHVYLQLCQYCTDVFVSDVLSKEEMLCQN